MTDKCIIRWIVVLLLVLAGGLSAARLTINDDALDLLPDGAVRGDLQMLQQIGLVDRIFISLSADGQLYLSADTARDALQKSAEALGQALVGRDDFTNVLAHLPVDLSGDLFTLLLHMLPLLLDEGDLEQIERKLTPAAIKEAMRENFLLLNSPVGMAMKERVRHDPLDFLSVLLNKLAFLQAEFQVRPDAGFLMSRDGRSLLVLAESTVSLTDSKNSELLDDELQAIFETVLQPGISAEMIGTLPHTLANSRIIKKDLRFLLAAATVMLTLLLAFTLRDIRAVVVFGVPFLGALPAIGITRFIFGEIGALALGFGIVILGIAVDFSVHLYLALTREKGGRKKILREVRKPILFACLTTVSVLVVLLLSDVASHRQMAVLALAGVLFGVVFAWLLIPTIVGDREGAATDASDAAPVENHSHAGRWILAMWLSLVAAGVLCWPHLHYNGDLAVLDASAREVVDVEKRFAATWGEKGEQAFVAATGTTTEKALQAAGKLFTFITTNGYTDIQSPVVLLPDRNTQERRLAQWRKFVDRNQPELLRALNESADKYGFSSRAFQPFVDNLIVPPDLIREQDYNQSVFAPLLGTMLRPWGGGDGVGSRLVLTTMGITDDNLQPLLEYEEKHSSITVLANRKWRAEVEHFLKKDILLLSSLAAVVVVLLVSLQFRDFRAVTAVLAPVVSALSAMSLFCWATSGDLNMMHLIMGIMVIGLSVDYGIFVVCSRLDRVAVSAKYAVSVCAASSLVGFGVLAFADHPALYSLGVTVLVGIGAAWPTALVISPLIVGKRGRS
ncbi:MMPL family transporter [Desulforhopalus singaporensis]|uniref:Membrane transport protein MMPL domain-containing protein n=1 Tax=Desulforhopalus singaporensis TaxID=91360 RepID=A0A1H0T4Y6_9BACT|nr:MMPL family transporter [Desulforhopalus singaporensis]SDP49152.1 hypothetical protein SAMN05660330_02933 [Desulforhopalus singaporensis]